MPNAHYICGPIEYYEEACGELGYVVDCVLLAKPVEEEVVVCHCISADYDPESPDIFMTREEVFERFPSLEGGYESEDGFYIYNLPKHTWNKES